MFRFTSRCSSWILAWFVLALLTSAAMAQSITGSVSGTVTDSSGGVIVGASVTLISDDTGAARTDVTNAEGRFTFSALRPGVYTLKVEQNGFQKLEPA